MAVISIRAFGGVSPKTPPRLLRENQAQVAENSGVFTGSLTPIKGLGTSVKTIVGTANTIYKFGQDSTDATAGWLSWAGDVDVERGQIAGDTEEWTFYTGDGYPKAIRAGYTTSPIPLGQAAPSSDPIATVGTAPVDTDGMTQETRVYAYTYVNKVGVRSIESSPSDASNSVDVWPTQSVVLSGMASPSSPYAATHVRIYRSTAGTFLFVAEITLSAALGGYTDTVDPEDLLEEIPSLTWLTPPDALAGLTNLPNGIMAGFSGRDVYFCEPYIPHAWPDEYRQTIDYPVVGLGRMDTTLAVLTKGTPYLIQGSHPDSMVVIKADVEQSCSSKRSIVSFDGSVFFCSPDGLVRLSAGGSQVITEQMFTYAQWQETVDPSSVHAYHHDRKYIAFYDNGTDTGCFVFDNITGELTFNTVDATAGYMNLRDDTLYLHDDGSVKPWNQGSDLTYTWRSKIVSLPRFVSMSCAQVEAESYPVTAKIYADGTLIHSQTVSSREPFRLPAKMARDWELELVGSVEVFNVAVAQSMEELANA